MDPNKTVFVQKSRLLNGVLRYSSINPILKSSGFIDRLDTLANRDLFSDFLKFLIDNDLKVQIVGASEEEQKEAEKDYAKLVAAIESKFEVNSPFLDDHELRTFQHVGLNLGWNRMLTDSPRFVPQWDTGAGKTLFSCMMAQKLFDEGKIDKVLVFCQLIKKQDWVDEFQRMTTLNVKRAENWNRAKRHRFYSEDTSQVLVMNYEKARGPSKKKIKGRRARVDDFSRTDIIQLLELIKDKKVLIVIDEVQKINTGTSLLSLGFDMLLNRENEETLAIGLTATPYTTSPLNLRNIYSVLVPGIPGVSDMSREAFMRLYGKVLDHSSFGYAPQLYVREWDLQKLPLLGKKHENWTHIAMKSDPNIAKQFPPKFPERIRYELSDADREIYDWAEGEVRRRYNPDSPQMSWTMIDTLRMLCNTTEGLRSSKGKFAQEIFEKFETLISMDHCNKYKIIKNDLEAILENGDKCMLFTYWTNNTLFPYSELLQRDFPKIPLFRIWGVGMTEEIRIQNKDRFNESKGAAILLSSDAGREGLSIYANYLWHIEVPRLYSDYKQRSDRIDRLDSLSKGITTTWIRRPVAINTIEERIDAKVLQRRIEAEMIRGVRDENTDMNSEVSVTPESFLF